MEQDNARAFSLAFSIGKKDCCSVEIIVHHRMDAVNGGQREACLQLSLARVGKGFTGRKDEGLVARQASTFLKLIHPFSSFISLFSPQQKKHTHSETPASASTRRTTPSRGTLPLHRLREAWTLRRAAASQTYLRARRPPQRRSPPALARRRPPCCSSSSNSRRRCPASPTTTLIITMEFSPLLPRRRPLVAWRRARWFREEKNGAFFPFSFPVFFFGSKNKMTQRGGPAAKKRGPPGAGQTNLCLSLLSTTNLFFLFHNSVSSTSEPFRLSRKKELQNASPLVFPAVILSQLVPKKNEQATFLVSSLSSLLLFLFFFCVCVCCFFFSLTK